MLSSRLVRVVDEEEIRIQYLDDKEIFPQLSLNGTDMVMNLLRFELSCADYSVHIETKHYIALFNFLAYK